MNSGSEIPRIARVIHAYLKGGNSLLLWALSKSKKGGFAEFNGQFSAAEERLVARNLHGMQGLGSIQRRFWILRQAHVLTRDDHPQRGALSHGQAGAAMS